MSLVKSSLLVASVVATMLAGSVAAAHAGISIDQQRAAKAKEPQLALQCALTPYHIWIYNPNPALVGHCEDHQPSAPAAPAPNWGNAGDVTWCGVMCGAYTYPSNRNPSPYGNLGR